MDNELVKMSDDIAQTDSMYSNVLNSIRHIIEQNKRELLSAANQIIVRTYWQIGQQIFEVEQKGESRAKYGKSLLKNISTELINDYGSGFSERNLAYARKLYMTFPDYTILQTRLQNLTWSHLCLIISVENSDARLWYAQEAQQEMWGVRTLQRI